MRAELLNNLWERLRRVDRAKISEEQEKKLRAGRKLSFSRMRLQ